MPTPRLRCWLLAAGLAALTAAQPAWAGPADPTPFIVLQPDGTPLVVRAVGDEWSNAHATLDGFTVVRDNTGLWTYGIRTVAGELVPTALVVGRDTAPEAAHGALADRPPGAPRVGDAAPSPAPMLGTRKTLVILVEFANKAALTSPADWKNSFFGSGAGSVYDHYQVSSYGQASVTGAPESHGTPNDGIVGWLSLPTNHPNTMGSTGTPNQQLTKDAILAADPFVDFASFDTNGNGVINRSELFIVVIAAGNETSYGGTANSCPLSVWGHVRNITSIAPPVVDGVQAGGTGYAQFGEMHCVNAQSPGQMATMGIMAHELGHLFGLPDLYDADVSSFGIGEWSLMSYGSWGRVTRSGDSPSLMDPWSKYFLGWVTPTAVLSTMVNQAVPASASSPTVFQFLSGSALTGTGEYFLVENRQKTGFDVSLPAGGLLIWHVDESRPSNALECIPGGTPVCSASVHYKVALIQADNQFHLERNLGDGDGGDPYPGTTGNTTFNASSAPDSRLWAGTASGVSVSAISASGPTMTATFGFGTPPAFVNIITNGGFLGGLTGWSTFATPEGSYIVSNTNGGVLQFHRTAPPAGTSNQAVVFQNTGVALPSGAAIQANFQLGNSDTQRKRISVLLQDADFSDLAVCTFWLPAALPLAPYQMRAHTTRSWSNATIAFYAATANAAGDTTGMYRVDDVQMQYAPNLPAERTECYDPLAPAAPGGAAGPGLVTNGDFSFGLTGWTLFGQINGAVNAGVFDFIRLAGNPAGVILQSTGHAMATNQILTSTFQLGNSSAVRKRVTVILHDSNFSDLSACTFWLAPGLPLSTYTYRTYATQAWANATFSVYAATVGVDPSMRLDNVALQRTPGTGIVGTECREP